MALLDCLHNNLFSFYSYGQQYQHWQLFLNINSDSINHIVVIFVGFNNCECDWHRLGIAILYHNGYAHFNNKCVKYGNIIRYNHAFTVNILFAFEFNNCVELKFPVLNCICISVHVCQSVTSTHVTSPKYMFQCHL